MPNAREFAKTAEAVLVRAKVVQEDVDVSGHGPVHVHVHAHAMAMAKAKERLKTVAGGRGWVTGAAWGLWLLLRETTKGEMGLVGDGEGEGGRWCLLVLRLPWRRDGVEEV